MASASLPFFSSLTAILHLIILISTLRLASALTPQWLVPDSSQPNLATTWNDGDSVTLSWSALNSSICDLWLTDPDSSNDYAIRLASNINLNQPGTLPWSINIGNEQLHISDVFVLCFIPTGQAYTPSSQSQQPQITSPSFVVLPEGSASPSATSAATTSATTTGTTDTTTTATTNTIPTGTANVSPGPQKSGGLSTGVKVGAAIAIVVALSLIIGLLLWVFRLRRRVKQAQIVDNDRKGILRSISSDTDLEMTPSSSPRLTSPPPAQQRNTKRRTLPGLHEMKADTRQPQEMSADGRGARWQRLKGEETTRGSVYEMPA